MSKGAVNLVLVLILISACTATKRSPVATNIKSLDELFISTLRDRQYGSRIHIEERLKGDRLGTMLVSYKSDGLRVYSRIDVPASDAGEKGYPVVLFVHGWMGIDAAPTSNFYIDDDSRYDTMIRSYVDAGFVVFTPGWRGHGIVNGVAADGIEFMAAWDNGSYLSPVFYAIDVLNLVDSLPTFGAAPLDLDNVNLIAHSQGGDVALIALAVAGEGSKLATGISAASIWSGCFPSRFTQLETYDPMQKSAQAFMSGDGTWNGTAVGANGAVNPDFVFGYPADWIGTPNVEQWTWQREVFSIPTVAEAVEDKVEEMYSAINRGVDDIDNATFSFQSAPGGRTQVIHDDRVKRAMAKIDAFYMAKFLSEPLVLQHSDRDFYSLSKWNAELCERINNHGGACQDFEYAGNTHSLGVSENSWFSGKDATPGFEIALKRDIEFFLSNRVTN
jgi:pimeloyl-ACP methyl ester carboxylesterase